MAVRNQSQTVSQNYRRLGLVSKLNARAGGVEKRASDFSALARGDALAIANKKPTTLVPGTVRIERDPETGAILRVIDDGNGGEKRGRREWNGRILRDVLDDGEGEEDEDVSRRGVGQQHDLSLTMTQSVGGEGVVPELVMQAATGGMKKRPRKQSQREEEWVEQLVERYGEDVGRMARDRRLNPMQQSERDIRRRVMMWKDGRRKGGGGDEMR